MAGLAPNITVGGRPQYGAPPIPHQEVIGVDEYNAGAMAAPQTSADERALARNLAAIVILSAVVLVALRAAGFEAGVTVRAGS